MSDDQYHYLSRVLRIRKKECLDVVVDELELLNIEFRGFIGSKMQYEKLNSNTFKSDFLEISLIQSLPKQNKFIEIIDNVTQAGVKYIYPVYTSRSIVKWDREKEAKYEKKVVSTLFICSITI